MCFLEKSTGKESNRYRKINICDYDFKYSKIRKKILSKLKINIHKSKNV